MSSWMYIPTSVPEFVPNVDESGLANVLVPAPPSAGVNLMANFVPADIEECASTFRKASEVNDFVLGLNTPLSSYQEINPIHAISTKFNADFKHDGIPPDTQLVCSDLVLFHAHRHMLVDASTNGFNNLLGSFGTFITVPETSDFLNIILHAIYGHPCSQFQHSIDTLMTAVCLLPKYGLQPKKFIQPSSPLFNDIRYQMPLSPLMTYVVSSVYELEELAVITSAHLLALDISAMGDEMVEFINPVYLKRLFDLQQRRIDKLKDLFSVPPYLHPARPHCDFIAQKALSRAWALYTAHLLWGARAGEIHAFHP
ncbi:uncharacterized protein BT62DRAFT_488225 [Guyanagaster necrorhizus]|uniref:BTB domain-containing protein n=1 Tax=Guyanagaster necrorhizus TaxID=856835 RepID=A0A9P7VK30_9AGAR|nr:uncharacterized protein BT62DRAFT_488225 [Guyanagaster necrorhizus MCA 3950]KAG7441431.1 hypothetical protein BT62DRAFT_488225 [Guyanagaster necrorhizus MCA 3950]